MVTALTSFARTDALRIIYESPPEPELDFFSFGIRASLAEKYLPPAVFELHTVQAELDTKFLDQMTQFVERSQQKGAEVDDLAVYCTAGWIPYECDDEEQPIPYMAFAILYRNRIIELQFDSLDKHLNGDQKYCLKVLRAEFLKKRNVIKGSQRERQYAAVVTKAVEIGLVSGFELLTRGEPYRLPN